MATPTTEINRETDLIGTVTSNLTATGLTLTAVFIDKKTGLARAPQSTTLEYTIDQDNSNSETIFCDTVTTTNGVTTLTIDAAGRNIPKFGTGAGSGTGLPHVIGAAIGCVDIARPLNLLAQIAGEKANLSGATFTGPVIVTGTSSYIEVPSMTTAQRLALPLANGIEVYDTTTGNWWKVEGGGWVTFGSGSVPNAAPTVAGKVETGTVAQQAAHTSVGTSGALLVPQIGNMITVSAGAGDAGKLAVTNAAGQFDSSLINVGTLPPPSFNDASNALIIVDVLADNVTQDQLVYRSPTDQQWHLVTSTTSTWYNELGIVLEAGSIGQSKHILLKGQLGNQTFNNINPTFSNALGGTDNPVGDATTALRASVINNIAGAECVISGGTVSVKHTGAPAGPFNIYLVLEQQDQSSTPACFYDSAAHVPRGAIIASASIPAASISGAYQNISYSYGGNFRIPAGQRVYEVYILTGAQSNANYYLVQSNAALANIPVASPSTWSGAANTTATRSLTVVSTSPVGYAVKAYAGSNGSYDLVGTGGWPRCIGTVISSTAFFFNPNQGFKQLGQGGHSVDGASQQGFDTITLGFCPSDIYVHVSCGNIATGNLFGEFNGYLRGDNIVGKYVPVSIGGSGNINFIRNARNGGDFSANFGVQINGMTASPGEAAQNYLHFVRLENGVYAYIGYPTGANYLSNGQTGWQLTNYAFNFIATS